MSPGVYYKSDGAIYNRPQPFIQPPALLVELAAVLFATTKQAGRVGDQGTSMSVHHGLSTQPWVLSAASGQDCLSPRGLP